MNTYKEWFDRAKGDMLIAKKLAKEEDLYLEDLCFHLQQSAEKALKGLILFYGGELRKTHDLSVLMGIVEQYVEVPDTILDVIRLDIYAVETRYPGSYNAVTHEEFESHLEVVERCLDWVENIIK
jgi:HEPN domain-containing protein